MKKAPVAMTPFLILVLFVQIFLYGCMASSQDAEEVKGPMAEITSVQTGSTTVSVTEDTDDVLINPGKGFFFLGYMDPEKYEAEFRDVISIGYNRFRWSKLEPEEGNYNWKEIDGYIKLFRDQGKQFAFGVMCANTSSDLKYITPEWVFEAGAKGKTITTENGDSQMIPDWTDPVFLEKLNNFIGALAERYDGDSNIAYIDIRSYGNWGEQHTYKIEDAWPDITAEQLKELYLRPYVEKFTRTQLVTPAGNDAYEETYKWAIEHGVTVRRDGIVSHSDGEEGRLVYGKMPAIFEYPSSYLSKARNEGDWQYDKVEEVVTNGAPTYLQIYEDMYFSNRAFYDRLANRIGYYFRFKGAVFQNEVNEGEAGDISLTFRNDGVAPIYEHASLKIGLLDQDCNLVQSYPVDTEPGQWMPGEEVTVKASPEFTAEGGLSGDYILAVGLFADDKDDKPDYKLGSTGKTDDNWYVFGTIKVKKKWFYL